MNEQRFFELLAAYGADVGRWPEEEQIAAERFLARASHRVKDIWESERYFDRLLAVEEDAPAPISLETRILASMPRPQPAPARRLFGGWNRRHAAAGGVVALSLLMGVAAGYAAEPPQQTGGDYAAMLSLSGTGVTSVFISAMNDTPPRDD